MSLTEEQKESAFAQELERIFDKKVREFTRLCIIYAPDYIFIDCPSASSGKFHPIDEIAPDGTIVHTKRVFTLAYDIVKGLDCEDRRDIVLSAAIIHDLRKYGPTNSGHTLKDHAAHGVNLIDEVQEATQLLTESQHKMLRNCVGYHYGPWGVEPWAKPMEDYTMEEMALYMSDFVVSKKFIRTDFRR